MMKRSIALILVAWGCVILGGIAAAPWFRQQFMRMLAFTTVDVESVVPQSQNPRDGRIRYEMKTTVVHSGSCRGNLSWCDYSKLEGEKDEISLPRSITFDFPAGIVGGTFADGSGIVLSVFHSDLSPFVPYQRKQREIGIDADGRPMRVFDPAPNDWRFDAGDTVVTATFRNFYHSRTSTSLVNFGPRWTAPGCDIADLGGGAFQYHHKSGYDARNKSTHHLRCAGQRLSVPDNNENQPEAFLLIVEADNGNIEMSAVCRYARSSCTGTRIFEQWVLVFRFSYNLGPDFVPVYRRIMSLIRSSVVARSYEAPVRDTP